MQKVRGYTLIMRKIAAKKDNIAKSGNMYRGDRTYKAGKTQDNVVNHNYLGNIV